MDEDQKQALGIRNGDLVSGAVLLCFGLYVGYEALGMTFGSITRPGPGFFPVVLVCLLIATAMTILLGALRSDTEKLTVEFDVGTVHIAVTILAVCVYGAVLETTGFLLSTFPLILGLMVGIGGVPWPRALAIAGIGTVFTYFVMTGLGIPLPAGTLFS